MNFEQWMNKVNAVCEKHFGLDTSHFADYSWMTAFEAGDTPAQAFQDFVESEGLGKYL